MLDISSTKRVHANASIQLLAPAVADQIAAGEVVERPAAALKELLENSLDAGASRISIRVLGGGIDLLEVSDDGRGIPETELRLALARYATSKIQSAADLSHIASFGFRGEALAAISAVSRVHLSSRPQAAEVGRELIAEASQILDERAKARPPGTTVRVENLFANTPARKKFLKTPAAERAQCLQIIYRLALAHPEIEFTLTADDTAPVVFPRTERLASRVARVFRLGFGVEVKEDELLHFARAKPNIKVHGFVLPLRLAVKHSRHIFAFVNGRAVKDKVLSQAALAAAREVSFGGEYPQLVLFLEIDPELVDVNVHPTKAEVRFRDPSPFGFVYKAVVESLATLRLPVTEPSHAPTPTQVTQVTSDLPLELGTQFRAKLEPCASPLPHSVVVTPPSALSAQSAPAVRFLGTIHDTYLVCQDADGLLLVDQHAAHERVTYERLRGLRLEPRPQTAPLLIPIGIELGRERADLLESLAGELAKLGLAIERFGPGQIRVTELPVLLLDSAGAPRVPLANFLGGFADALAADVAPETLADEFRRTLLDAVATESCHASVRAGQTLSRLEADALLAQMQATDFAAHCPHGRPTSVRLSWNDIEKLFKRRI